MTQYTSPGKSGSTSVYASPVDGWTGTANLTCALSTGIVQPAQDMPTCSLNPASVVVGANQVSSTLTVNTTAPSLVPPAPLEGPPARPWPFGFWFGLLGWLGLAVFALLRKDRNPDVQVAFRWAFSALLVSVLLGVALWGSCGGGGGSSGGGGGGGNTVTKSGTSTGTYTVTVTGVSGSLQHQTVVTLIVQ